MVKKKKINREKEERGRKNGNLRFSLRPSRTSPRRKINGVSPLRISTLAMKKT